jgi:hypothetical protein
LVRCGRLTGPSQASQRGWTTRRNGKGSVIS